MVQSFGSAPCELVKALHNSQRGNTMHKPGNSWTAPENADYTAEQEAIVGKGMASGSVIR